MRIAMVSEHASPLARPGGVDSGGQNVHVDALSAGLAARGHDVTVYTRRDARALPTRVRTPAGVIVEHVCAGPPAPLPKDSLLEWMPEFGRHLAAAWAWEPPDVVHAHFWMSGLAALPAAGDLCRPTVQTFHALGAVKTRHQGRLDTSPAARLRLEARLARSVDHIVATSSDEVSELRRLGVARNRVTVVPCGVDVSHFSPAARPRRRASRPRVLCVSRLVERKGVDTVIRALAALPGVELVVAGGPAPERMRADPEVRRLRAVAAAAGVADRVRLLGSVPRDQLPTLLRSADVVACLSWYEPFGIVPLEAMACGVPVVASAVGGHLDTVVDDVTGVLVPPRDPAALAATLGPLLADAARRGRYAAAGVEWARDRFRWERVAADTEAVYYTLAAASEGRRVAAALR